MKIKSLGLVLLLLPLGGCKIISDYKTNIQQGTHLTEAKLNAIHKGMTKAEVLAQLGTPVYTAEGDENQWHYVEVIYVRGNATHKRLTVFFEADRVVGVDKKS